MDCYLISSPEGMEAFEVFNEMGIEATSDSSCFNCYSSQLEPWQVIELTHRGFILYKDTKCSL